MQSSMKHLVAIGVLVAVAFGVRAWLQTSFALDIPSIHRLVPLRTMPTGEEPLGKSPPTLAARTMTHC